MIIKVAYDISVLGRCFTNPASRTGLYRVIGEILQELNKKLKKIHDHKSCV